MAEIIAPQILVVPELTVNVTTGETCYPGENGFSQHWAELTTTEPALVQRLSALANTHTCVLLRCAKLDVTGRVTKSERTDGGTRFVFSIESVVYRRSERGPDVV